MKNYKLVFWGIIVVGLVLPLFVLMTVEIMATDKSFLNILISWITNKDSELALALVNAAPYIVLARFAKRRLLNLTPQNKYYYIAEMIGAGVPLVFLNLYVHMSIWHDLYVNHASSSTMGLVFGYFSFFYAFIIMFIGGVIGSLVGRLISAIKRVKA